MDAVDATAPIPQQRPLGAAACIAAFMAEFSVEATRPSDADIAALAPLGPGARVYLSAPPSRAADESVAAAIRLRAAGFVPVPHLAVRNFGTVTAFDEVLARLNGEAAVDSVLVVAGDRADCGPFRSAIDAIDSGLLWRRGIRAIAVAGYPQGHPRISNEELDRALADKIAAAEAVGLAVEIVTQFCFDGQAILDYVARLRAFGFEHRLRVGLVGPTSLAALLRYAHRCGVRASAQALARRAGLMQQMFALTTPDDLVWALAKAAPSGVMPHFFSFGGVAATSRWARAVADGCIVPGAGGGFLVEPVPQ